MKSNIEELNETVLTAISKLIIIHLRNAAYEQYTPSSDPDKMDSTIADATKKAEALRHLRQEFETISTGIILPF